MNNKDNREKQNPVNNGNNSQINEQYRKNRNNTNQGINQFDEEFAEEITIQPTGTTFVDTERNKTKSNRDVKRRDYEDQEY